MAIKLTQCYIEWTKIHSEKCCETFCRFIQTLQGTLSLIWETSAGKPRVRTVDDACFSPGQTVRSLHGISSHLLLHEQFSIVHLKSAYCNRILYLVKE